MIILIPAAIGLTIMIALVFMHASDPTVDHMQRVTAGNMLLQHRAAVEHVLREDITTGTLPDFMTAPMRNMGGWVSIAAPGSDRTIVATFPGNVSSISDRRLVESVAKIAPVDIRHLPNSAAGIYDLAGARVGRISISDASIAVPDGAPVIVTIVTENAPG